MRDLVKYIFSRSLPLQGTDCIIWQGAISREHGMLSGGEYVHRAVYEFHKGPIPAGLEIGHTCDRGACVNPAHLEAVTRQQNVQDAFSRGRFKRGRYTDEDVKALREGHMSPREFAVKFELTAKTVYAIKAGWKAKWRG